MDRISWLCVGALVAQTCSTLLPATVRAGSESQSRLSGSAIEATRDVDPRGLTTWRKDRHRTPSGLLHPFPFEPLPWRGEAFQLRSSVDFGFVLNRGEASEAAFQKYADRSDGFLLRRFLLEGRRRDGSYYFELGGGSVARSDQFFRGELGRHGLFRLRGAFESLEHVSMDDARVLFQGVGGERLTLPAPLVPGANASSDVNAALASIGKSRISQERDEGEVELRVTLHPRLTLLADYRHRERDGERAFGGTLGAAFGSSNAGSVAETLIPEESVAHDFSLGMQYANPKLQANLRYRGSIYDNRNASLTWENPFSAFSAGGTTRQGISQGRAALAPDNELHQITSDFGLSLPLSGRLTTHVSWTRMLQDQRLLPATINPAITAFGSLSRDSADARVDQLLVQSRLRLMPVSKVTMQLGFRYSIRDNDTNYSSFDPTTGAFGYVTEDESLTNRIGATPFSLRRYRLDGRVDWRFARRSRVGIEFRHETTERENRARREVNDARLRLNATTALIPHTQLRLAYTYSKRSGSAYSASRDARYYADAGPGNPPRTGGPARSLQQFRQYDLGSHDEHDVMLRANWSIGPRVDLSLATRYALRDYRASLGVTNTRLAEVSLDTSVQISPRLTGHGFASFEWRDRRMATINGAVGLGPSTDFRAGSARFPLSNRWSWDSDSRGITLGAGLFAQPIEKIELRADYRFQRSHEVIDLDFDRTGGALAAGTNAATARSRFPTLRQIDHVVESSAAYHWSEAITTRVFYRFQYSTIQDFHQDGIKPVVNHLLFLGHADDDFAVHVVGLTARLRY